MPPLLESQHKLWRRRKKRKKKDNVQFCLLGFPHCSCQLCSPWASRTTRYTPDKSTQAEKKYQGTKALYVMLSGCIDFFFLPVYLTDNIKSLLHVMSSWASEIASALPIPFSPLEEIVLGLYFVERLWVIHLCKLWMCLLPLHSNTYTNCSTESKPQIWEFVHWTTKQWVVQHLRPGSVLSVWLWMDEFKDWSRNGVLVCLWVLVQDQQLCNQTRLWPYLSGRSSKPSIMSRCHAHADESLVACNLWAGLTCSPDLVRIRHNCQHCRDFQGIQYIILPP